MKTVVGIFLILLVLALLPLYVVWTDSCVDFCLAQIKGEPVNLFWGWSLLIIIFGPCTMLFNIAMEIWEAAL